MGNCFQKLLASEKLNSQMAKNLRSIFFKASQILHGTNLAQQLINSPMADSVSLVYNNCTDPFVIRPIGCGGSGGGLQPPNNLLMFVDFSSERGCESQGCGSEDWNSYIVKKATTIYQKCNIYLVLMFFLIFLFSPSYSFIDQERDLEQVHGEVLKHLVLKCS